MIIKEEDVVITHFGIRGMRWGIRKERYEQNREKAKNILKTQSQNKEMNVHDLASAEWMSKSVPDKISGVFFRNAVGTVATKIMLQGPESLKDPKEIAKLASMISKKTATTALLNEVSSASSLRRYDKSGAKDISKKQYKKHSLTPEIAVSRGIRVGMVVAPFVKAYGGATVHALAERKRQRQAAVDARMKSWGPNLLDKKTSEFHTIYDDGYMSVLERIKKG